MKTTTKWPTWPCSAPASRTTLFPFEDPLGKTILVTNKMPFRVVGVLGDRTPIGSGEGKVAEELNNDVYIPL